MSRSAKSKKELSGPWFRNSHSPSPDYLVLHVYLDCESQHCLMSCMRMKTCMKMVAVWGYASGPGWCVSCQSIRVRIWEIVHIRAFGPRDRINQVNQEVTEPSKVTFSDDFHLIHWRRYNKWDAICRINITGISLSMKHSWHLSIFNPLSSCAILPLSLPFDSPKLTHPHFPLICIGLKLVVHCLWLYIAYWLPVYHLSAFLLHEHRGDVQRLPCDTVTTMHL